MTIKEINELISPDIAVGILSSLGIDAKLKGNFRLRAGDKTPSASIYFKNGKVKIKDFGSGFNGDLFDTLKEYFNMDYKEAKQYILNYMGIKIDDKNFNVDNYKKELKIIQPVKSETLPYRQIQEKWNTYTLLNKLNENKLKEVINKLIPFGYVETANKEDKRVFNNSVRYDARKDEPVVATYTPAGEILTIKHRRYKIEDKVIKWKSLKGTEANKYCQIRITNKDNPVFIIEGTHDYITAILLGINFIALPYKGYKRFKDDELSLLKRQKYDFVLIPDLDYKSEDDEKYKSFLKEIDEKLKVFIPQLKPYTKDIITIWNLRKTFKYFEEHKDIRLNMNEVKDLTNLCEIYGNYESSFVKSELETTFIIDDKIFENEVSKKNNQRKKRYENNK